MSTTKKKIEVFSAGCSTCKETIELVKKLAGSAHEVEIHDRNKSEVASRAKTFGVRSIPAVVIDGKLASCCAGRGPKEHILRSALAQFSIVESKGQGGHHSPCPFCYTPPSHRLDIATIFLQLSKHASRAIKEVHRKSC